MLMTMSEQHGRNGYERGCRCDTCRRAQRERIAAQRARRRGLAPVPEVRQSDAPDEPAQVSGNRAPVENFSPVANATPGPCEVATAAELESLPAAESHQALAAAALCMARILDNRLWVTTQPSVCRQLSSLMLTIRKASAAPRGRLAAISKMATRPDAG